ncbi:hypothetical protein BDF14DRAFT_1809396 [Spinellus fusiger]|nr:hypothetical protein BDF14DRAFT_1809396 [Spinellus fusiger]
MRFFIFVTLCLLIGSAMTATVQSNRYSIEESNDLLSSSKDLLLESHNHEVHSSGSLHKRKTKTNFASPDILQTGLFFYIALSVSTLLWCTGKGIDMTLMRQERLAETVTF